MAEHLNRLLKSTILYLPAQFMPPFVQFVTTVVWTYLLDPATFGFVVFIISIQEIMACAGLTGWTLYMLRFRERFRDRGEDRFRAMDKRMTLLGAATQFVLTPPLLMLLGLPCDAPTIVATASYLVTRMVLTHYGDWARADHAIGAYTIGQVVGAVVGSLLSIVAILTFGPSSAVVLAAQAVGQALALALLVSRTNIRFGVGTFDSELFGEVRRYAAPALIGGVIGWVAGNIIRVLVQYMDGAVALGLISVGWGLGQRIAGVLAMLLTAAAYPLAVKHLEAGDRKGALAQVSFNGLLLFGVLLPAAVGATLLSEPIVTLLIAEKFRATTIVILPIALCAASLRFLRLHTCEQTLLLLERTNVTMYITMIESTLNVTLCALGLYLYGYYGAAAGMLIGSAIVCVGAFAFCFAKLGLPAPPCSTALRIVSACGAMGLVVRALPVSATAASLAFAILLGAATYAVCLAMLFPAIRALLARRFFPFPREATP